MNNTDDETFVTSIPADPPLPPETITITINHRRVANLEDNIVEYVRKNTVVSFRELEEAFRNYVGENKLRKVLRGLVNKKVLRPLSNGRYYMLNNSSER